MGGKTFWHRSTEGGLMWIVSVSMIIINMTFAVAVAVKLAAPLAESGEWAAVALTAIIFQAHVVAALWFWDKTGQHSQPR